MTNDFYFESNLVDNVLIIKNLEIVDKSIYYSKELDISRLKELVNKTQPQKIIFDFTDIDRIDSCMIGILVEFANEFSENSIFLSNLLPHMKHKLSIIGIKNLFQIIP